MAQKWNIIGAENGLENGPVNGTESGPENGTENGPKNGPECSRNGPENV